jgi:TPR repeat protein
MAQICRTQPEEGHEPMCRTLFLLLASTIFFNGCDVKGYKPMNTPAVNWEALEFTCVYEENILPKSDPEVDKWYKMANASYKAGVKMKNENLLRESFELMLRAAERGHVKAMNNLVLAYLDGDGVKVNEGKAVEWTEKLIEKNIGMGYYHMGVFLQQGIGVKQDRKAALEYFRKAADLGNAQGQLMVGNEIRRAAAQTSNREKGFSIGTSMLRCALTQGLADAGRSLGFHYLAEKNIDEALKAFQNAARLGHNQSLFTLMSIFEEGKYGIAKDEARAACYRRLSDESDADKTKTFPDIDRICPLPPKPMPKSSS